MKLIFGSERHTTYPPPPGGCTTVCTLMNDLLTVIAKGSASN